MEKIKEPSTLGEKVDKVLAMQEEASGVGKKGKKQRTFKLPFKARLNHAKLKAGFATVIEVRENNALNFRREKIIDSTIKLDDTYHAVDDESTLTYKGKPCLIIAKKSKNPYNPNRSNNETFGQKHIMSRMMNEVLGVAKKQLGIAGISIGGIILLGVLVYAFVAG